MSLSYEASVIFVRDIVVSRAFYEGLLGRTLMADHGENVVYVGGLSLWQAEHASSIVFGKKKTRQRWGADNLELYFESDDIDAEFERLQASGVRLIHKVHEEPWGQRTFRCWDPDGHIIEVGEPMPASIRRLLDQGYKPEDIVKRTSMPMELVLQAIGYPRFC